MKSFGRSLVVREQDIMLRVRERERGRRENMEIGQFINSFDMGEQAHRLQKRISMDLFIHITIHHGAVEIVIKAVM